MPYFGNSPVAGDHVNNFKVLDDISSHTATFDGSATNVVDTTNNTIRVVEHRFIQGQRVTYTNGGGGNIGGLTTGTAYFVIFDTASTFKLATSASNAANSVAINLSSVGSGSSHTLNVAFDGVNTKFKITYNNGTAARFNNATQLNIAINNVLQKPNNSSLTFTEGFAIEDSHKIVFKIAPTSQDIFWGSIIANTLTTFDISDHKIDTFTGDGSTTEFTLSHTPANNESLMVTINGVLQHPSNASTARAYTLIASIIQFTAAPANGDEIQVRHLGFAGATTADVSGFYGRTGNVVLTANDHITTGDITARNINASGILTASSANFSGNVSIGGTLTYEDVSNIDSVGIITARDGIDCNGDLDVDGHTNLDNVSVAGVTTFSDTVNVGTGVTIFTNGRADFTGFTTFSAGAQIPFNKNLIIGPSSLYGSIKYPHGFSGLEFDALNQMRFRCWDGNSTERWLYANGVSGYVDILGTEMGGPKAPLLRVQGKTTQQIIMSSSDGSNLTERFKLSQSGFNFTGLSTHTGNFNLDGDLDVDGHTNLDNVSIAGVTTTSSLFNVREAHNTAYSATASPDAFSVGNINSSANTNFTGIHLFTDGNGRGVVNLNALNNSTNASADFTIQTRHNGTLGERFRIASNGNITVNNNLNISGDLDVDGHTNLDNVSIAGVTTFASNVFLGDNDRILFGDGGMSDAHVRYDGNHLQLGVASGQFRVSADTANFVNYAGSQTLATINTNSVTIPTKLGINGAAPQTPLDVVANSSGYAINIRGRSSDNIGELRFTSNNYGSLYGTLKGGATYLNFSVDSISSALRLNSTGLVTMDNATAQLGLRDSGVVDNAIFYIGGGTRTQTSSTTDFTQICLFDKNSQNNGTTQSGSWKSKIKFFAAQINGGAREGAFIGQDTTYNNFSGSTIKMRSDLIFGTRGDQQTSSSDPATEKLRIRHSGQIQISEPSGTSGDGASLKFFFGNNNSTDVISSIIFANNVGEVATITGETRNGNNYGMIRFSNQVNGVNGESMRLNHDGGFCVGTDSTRTAEFSHPDGFSIRSRDASKGQFQNTVTDVMGGLMNRDGSDGAILGFRREGSIVGHIGVNGSTMYLNFGGTSAADHQLDDYEEGNYTPTATLGSGSITSTTSFSLRYIRIGRYVLLTGRLHFSTSQNNLSSFQLSLPFANSSGNSYDTSCIVHVIRGNGGDPVQGIRIFRLGPGATTMAMNDHEGNTYGDLGTTTPHININISYFAAP